MDFTKLAQLYKQRDALAEPYLDKIAALEAQMTEATAALDVEIKALEAQAKECAINAGGTVKNSGVQVIYVKPSTKWNNGVLEGYALVHPEILTARTIGQPSARIRRYDD